MYKSPVNFFYETALPDYLAYEESRVTNTGGQHSDLRLAAHAANGLFHLADHVFVTFQGMTAIGGASKLGQYVDFLVHKCPDFGLVRDCANAHKHRELTRGSPNFNDADCMRETFVLTEYRDEKGVYRIATKEIHVSLMDGTSRKMEDILLNVVNMWYEELHRLGLLSEKFKKEGMPFVIPERKAEGEGAPFNLSARKGLDAQFNFQLKRYNYATGQSEPIDITGADFQLKVYKPPIHEIEIAASEDARGRKITRTVTLRDDEFMRFNALSTEDEKTRYLMALPQVKSAQEELVQEIKELT